MAIQKPMTKEEYVKKYGVQPFQSVTLPEEEKRNIAQKIGGFLGIEKFGQGVGQALLRFTPEQKMLDEVAARGDINQEQYEDIATGGLKNREVLGSAVNTAAMFAPGAAKGAKLGAKIGAGAATGYALDVGSKLQNKETPLSNAVTPGVGTAIGATLPIIGGILGKVSPRKLEEINLRMTPHEKQLMAKQGKDIPRFLAERKIVGSPATRYQKIKQLYNSLEEKVGVTIKQSGVEYPKEDVVDMVRSIPEQFKDDITGYDEAVKVANKIEEFIQTKSPPKISGELLNKYKRNLFQRAYSKNNTDVMNDSLHAVASSFKDLIDNTIPELQKINQEYGNVILAKKILFKAMSRPQLGITGKILGTVAGGGIGASAGGGMGAAVGAVVGEKVAEKALGTATRSAVGAGLQSLIDKLPTDKVGNLQIGKKALIRLLQQGFSE